MNKTEKTLLKLSEELSELTTRIFQHLNKDKDYSIKIAEEIKDIEKQISILKELI